LERSTKVETQRPRLFHILIIVIISMFILSCSLLSVGKTSTTVPTLTSEPTVQPTNTEPPAPTNTAEPTVAVPTVPLPTNPPPVDVQAPAPTQQPAAAPDFFTEEFNGDLSNWEYFFTSGDEDLASFYTENGKLKFFLKGEQIYAYLLYAPYYYSDVALTVEAENRGFNDNNVSLICRYDYQRGWYEFSIANNGLYWIYYYDIMNESGYNLIANGGSTSIHTGKDTNTYSIVCKGKTLILYINNQEVKRFEETRYVLKEGQVGVGVSSFDVLPIEVEFEYLTIE
ncbi:MAG: hypothetical protein AAGU05_08920, partial [Anaerolineaceae bacterium]